MFISAYFLLHLANKNQVLTVEYVDIPEKWENKSIRDWIDNSELENSIKKLPIRILYDKDSLWLNVLYVMSKHKKGEKITYYPTMFYNTMDFLNRGELP